MNVARPSSSAVQPKLRWQSCLQFIKPIAADWATRALLLLIVGVMWCSELSARSDQHLSIIQPGGLPGWPVMTGVVPGTNSATVTWDGPSGYYQLFYKHGVKDPVWQALGKATNLSRMAIVTPLTNNEFFRVTGPSPQYLGWQNCAECHGPTLTTVAKTPHAAAFTNSLFVSMGGQTNSSCLACHTVGYHLPTGFNTKTTTPQLGAVQCENCHGSAANHAANPGDPISVPRVELAGTLCGGCHNAKFAPAQVAYSHPPLYEEWNGSAHSTVTPDVQQNFLGNSNISQCGRCHSGSVREALTENETLPSGQEAAAIGITCATCHDPHQNYVYTNGLNGIATNVAGGVLITNNQLGAVYTNQLRYPLASTNDYFLTTSSTFTNNPNINLCAQCHNHRGASWQTTSRSPHHSPQYNMLLGTVGELESGTNSPQPGSHAFLENQCVHCHMQTPNGSAGHSFEVTTYDTCRQCHPAPDVSVNLITNNISQQIVYIKTQLLDYWAQTKAPATLWTKYGTRAWEYTTPGDLSPGGPGPSSSEQALIPVNIQKARYNLYLVLYDGSFGVHNINYIAQLLASAEDWVTAELNQ